MRKSFFFNRILFFLLIPAVFVTSCSSQALSPAAANSSKLNETEEVPNAELNLSTPTEQVDPSIKIWMDPNLPESFKSQIQLPNGSISTSTAEDSNLQILPGEENPISSWVYALVAPFPTIEDNVTSKSLLDFWNGTETEEDLPFRTILADESTIQMVTPLLGIPDASKVIATNDSVLQEIAWNQTNTWAIIPFENLDPKWKVISIDGLSPIHKGFETETYLLDAKISISGPDSLIASLQKNNGASSSQLIAPATNRQSDHMTTLVLTGVTALVRATAAMMENFGMTYPDQDIRDILVNADITHINNEVPFTPKCPQPHPQGPGNLVFCSQPEYAELLQDVGTDIVELDGDHFQDWGTDAVYYTLNLYKQLGMKTYGGGENIDAAKAPLLIENNGNKFAFFGCNGKDIGYAGATETSPGAWHCDIPWMMDQIQQLKQQGYIPIVTFQHVEYYSYKAYDPQMLSDFRHVAEAGAVIVSGSQAHQPQSMEFYGDEFIHYGLGNLFFDQYSEGLETRQAFIDRHVFYDGKYISTELLPIIFVDYARSRPMTIPEKQDLLSTIFEASGWVH